MVNKTEKSVAFTKGISLRTNKVCRYEITDGVKYVSEGTSRVCGRSLTLAAMCFLLFLFYMHVHSIKYSNISNTYKSIITN